MFNRGRGRHPGNCQCGVCRGGNFQDRGAVQKLFKLVGGSFNVQAAQEAQRYGYLEEFSPELVEALDHVPEAARLWEEMK